MLAIGGFSNKKHEKAGRLPKRFSDVGFRRFSRYILYIYLSLSVDISITCTVLLVSRRAPHSEMLFQLSPLQRNRQSGKGKPLFHVSKTSAYDVLLYSKRSNVFSHLNSTLYVSVPGPPGVFLKHFLEVSLRLIGARDRLSSSVSCRR